MSHYDIVYALFFAGLAIILIFSHYGFYCKGCRDAWRKADEIAQMEPLIPPPPAKESQLIELTNWQGMILTINCQECQDEQAL